MHHFFPENLFALKFNYNKLKTFLQSVLFKLSKLIDQNETYQRLNETRFTTWFNYKM